MTRILVLPQIIAPGQYSGGSSLRLLAPLKRLQAKDDSLEITVSDRPLLDGWDAIILERYHHDQITPDALVALVEALRAKTRCLIHTLDDNLYDHLQELGPAGEKRLIATSYITRRADAVICSTPALAEVVRRLNPSVQVFSNYLPFVRTAASARLRAAAGSVEIGYMGTFTHLGDLRMIAPALKAALHDEPRLKFSVVGVGDQEGVRSLMAPYPVAFHSPPDHAYLPFLEWFQTNLAWDIAIAPLQDTALNRAKSDLKFLDYSSLPAAGIFSDVEPYHWLNQTELGLVVRNETGDWLEAILRLGRDAALRQNIAKAAHGYLLRERMLENHAHELGEILLGILQETARRPREKLGQAAAE